MTGPSPRERYREALATLAEPLQRRLVARDRAQQELVAGRRAITDRLASSAQRVTDAETALASARSAAERAEAEAARLWRDLAGYCGRRGRELGELPAPAPDGDAAAGGAGSGGGRAAAATRSGGTTPGGTVSGGTVSGGTAAGGGAGSAAALLERARRMLAAARRGELPLASPVPVWAAMVGAGALGAAILVGVARALASASHQMSGPEYTMVHVVATVAVIAAPLGGVPIGLTWLSRYGRPATARLVALLLVTGVVIGYGLSAVLAL